MSRLRVLCVGRKAKDPLLDAADDYLGRLLRYAKAELVRVRDGSPAEERDRLLKKLEGVGGQIIALDERGDAVTTMALAAQIDRWRSDGVTDVTFVIGGADGLAPEVTARAHRLVSLSALTLPHRMALVLLLEQLYRAHTILRGEKYHRP